MCKTTLTMDMVVFGCRSLPANFHERTLQRTRMGAPLHHNKPQMQPTALQLPMISTPLSFGISTKDRRRPTRFTCRAYTESSESQVARELQKSKLELLRAAQNTQRGFQASHDQRATIEEAMVSVEQYDACIPINLNQLDGTWLLQYTSASDVLVLFQAASLPFFQENEGATLLVTAKFSLLSQRNIYLQFEEVSVGNLMISEQLQTLIAPAFLPRTSLSLEILQLLRSFETKIPLLGNSDEQADRRPSPGGLYYLSYLDRDMLLGRALGGGGVFIFSRTQPFQV